MPFCPNCQYEYKPDVRKCPECGARLVDQLSEEKPPEGLNFVPLRSLPSRMYAEMVQQALKKERIPSIIKSDDIAITFGSYGTTSAVPVTIWVPKDKMEKSAKIADQMLDHI